MGKTDGKKTNRKAFTDLMARIENFQDHGDNWDGDGAREIPHVAIADAYEFVKTLQDALPSMPPTSVAPSPDGEVVVYWHRKPHYAEVNFDGSGEHMLCIRDDVEGGIRTTNESTEELIKPQTSVIFRKLTKFVGETLSVNRQRAENRSLAR